MSGDQRGRTALVTGASSGFGYLTALRLARLGWTVYAGFRDVAASGTLAAEAASSGCADRIRPVRLDVTDEAGIREALSRIEREAGRLDALVNNAGLAVGGFVEELPLSAWREQFDTNLFGVVAVTRAALSLLRQSGGGRIVLVSSISGRIGFPALGPYCASKHALEGLGESLRLELAPFGVAVSLVEPGPYRTPIWQKSLASVTAPGPQSPYAGLFARIRPMLEQSAARGGDPELVAETIVRAVRDKKPKLRYLPSWSERWTVGAKRFLPWSWIERAALRVLGVKR
ncbi:SDR family NAD(P)-dependent oxidoreductase [Cohnella candidum]|uniref:SDR family oxidoreductase n=1 Tax=Cohnella candidum TaxID=2674991 RepID=A0A3G3K4F3_9BACL|nr:SDR family NAD(P)-dependent oxidoreductase [Cohnella candidum]AYQ75280.1 SDR family oxidoreductase [Cohnella candidum]